MPPLSINKTVSSGDQTSIEVLCSEHGLGTRNIPTPYLGLLQEANKTALDQVRHKDLVTPKPNRWVDEVLFKCSKCSEIGDVKQAQPYDNLMELQIADFNAFSDRR